MAQHIADRRRDVTLGQHPRSDLVEQCLKQVMVGLIDDDHLDRRASERLGGEQAAEPAADDDDAMHDSHHRRRFGLRRDAIGPQHPDVLLVVAPLDRETLEHPRVRVDQKALLR
jgi:hypothetical protein